LQDFGALNQIAKLHIFFETAIFLGYKSKKTVAFTAYDSPRGAITPSGICLCMESPGINHAERCVVLPVRHQKEQQSPRNAP
jgi:hypothetical protein